MKHLGQTEAEYYQKLIDAGYSRADAARMTKKDLELPHTQGTLMRTLPDIAKACAIMPDIPNNLPDELVVPYQDCVVVGDAHMPYIHKPAMIRMLCQAKEANIKTLVLNGDALDFDWASYFISMAAPGTMEAVELHRRAIYDIMYALSGIFTKIYITRGNHDERLLARANKLLSLQSVWHMFACPDDKWRDRDGNKLPNLLNVCEITERFYMTMTGSPTGDWRFTHQKNYSVIPGRVASRLATKFNCNVIAAHEHHLAMVTSGTVANHYALSGGWLGDERKVEYKQMRDTLHPKSTVGWIALVDGVPQVFRGIRPCDK